MSYLAVKHLHITFAVLSGMFFFIRGLLMMSDSALLQQRWMRILPHVNDTLLLAAAIALALWSGQYPFAQGWLTAKVVGLIAYILLGTIALKRGKTKKIRIVAFSAALGVFAYIIKVAVTRQVF